MFRVKTSEVDQGGFNIRTSKTENGRYQAIVDGKPEIKPIYADNERRAFEEMGNKLDQLSRSGELDG